MAAEEAYVPMTPKIARFLYFVAAGYICTTAINKWRDYDRKSNLKRQQQDNDQLPQQIPSDVVYKASE
ncbi:uncharacterized protein LOC124916736 [Impatiens glandulifera]|uniref:uncharacterized protein LOC124916736 n=1 Tax=Impatiens glandulifera TaxID=253017 RepID=UPI001FB04D8A|nr:uncharacterized protein LOC124916736 [Impatiens glandulifera]